ncbi:MAG: IscS subfamily cysteine desulfurase [Candidatus Binatus sp.]|uniref:IscS subfamily cysteine desulfurase n=1 Tax=Candidatus Binatus sp. TaxID=2811406 RepID=UPI00271A126E|nr:IscS subfamily cysteine desulfurase [Candidatus Binatus sp.]MDO8431129.1 IscS subfamily cysteine desulfurase [Candidatus Binatus sp.]
MLKTPVYMDNHATTRVDSRVLEAMLPYFTEKFGNAASRNHSFGWEAEEGVDRARNQIAALIGAKSKEIIFTSGATESDNLAIKGVVEFYKEKGNHIITCVTEHKAVLDSCRALERAGKATVTYLPVDKFGMVDPDAVRKAITDKTVLITIMWANNEIGTLHPIAEIGKIAKEKGVIFHCDAVQAIGKVPVDVEKAGIDLASITAHKIYGPKGIGAIYVRSKGPRVRLTPTMDGGGHERGMRSGTLNVPGIVGLGAACEIAGNSMPEESHRLLQLRSKLEAGLFERLDEIYVNGHPTERLPGNLNVSFAYVEGESLLMGINDIAVSSGSACTSATLEPSYVIRALGINEELAHSSIRFGLGRFNTEEEVDYVTERVTKEVKRLRDMSPLYEMAKEGIDLKSVNWKQ